MAYPPFITAMPAEDEPEAPSNVVEFPKLVSARQNLRYLQRELARCEERIENCDPNSRNLQERLRASLAPEMLPHWRDEIRKAEAQIAMLEATDTLSFGGRLYQAVRSTAGAN